MEIRSFLERDYPRIINPAAHLIGLWLLLPLAVASPLIGMGLGLLTRWASPATGG